MKQLLQAIFAACIALTIAGFAGRSLHFISASGVLLVSPRLYKLAAALCVFLVLGALCVSLYRFLRKSSPASRHFGIFEAPQLTDGLIFSNVFLAVLALYFASDITTRKFVFFQSDSIPFTVLWVGLLCVVVGLCRLQRAARGSILSPSAVLLLQLFLAMIFFESLNGRMLFSDDHPSFLYRFQMLRHHFPYVPFYNAGWNAGYIAREFFPSGILNVAFLSLPFLLLPGWDTFALGSLYYNLVLIWMYVLIIPWGIYASSRVFSFSVRTSSLAAILSLAPSMIFFEWLLKYGTLGFVASAGLAPLAIALSYRLALDERQPGWRDVLFLLVIGSLSLCWSLTFLALLPVTLLALLYRKTVFQRNRRKFIVLFVLLFVLCNASWIYLFFKESRVASFLSTNTLPGSTDTTFHRELEDEDGAAAADATSVERTAPSPLRSSLLAFRAQVVKVNPVLIFLWIPGLLWVRNRRVAVVLGMSIGWLLIVSAFGESLKPQLELRRFILPASYLMAILAAETSVQLLDRYFRQSVEAVGLLRRGVSMLAAAVLCGMIALTPLTATQAYANRSDERFKAAPKYFEELADAIKTYGGSGRNFILGFILHDFGATDYQFQDGGHVAPLVSYSGQPMYAFDYYHYRWSSVDPIPLQFRTRGAEGIEEFLDLMNVTSVITFRREWADYCQAHPERYKQVEMFNRFRLFTRVGPQSGYFQSGKGSLEVLPDSLRVTAASDEVGLKFRYYDSLVVVPETAASLSGEMEFVEQLGGGQEQEVPFIKIDVHQLGVPFEIRYGRHLLNPLGLK